MKIYFAGSIRGGRDDQELYLSIIKELGKFGRVLTEHIGKKEISSRGEGGISDKEVFKRDIAWLKEADIVVAEVTTPSLGVGYELGKAEALGKRIIGLFRQTKEENLSAMIAGNPYIKIFKYSSMEDIEKILSDNITI